MIRKLRTCAGPWGVLVFGGGVHEHRFTNETWLLPQLGGRWTQLHYPEGSYPTIRAVAGIAKYGEGCILFGGVQRTDGDANAWPVFSLLDDTWMWTLARGWEQLEITGPTPPPRFYHTLKELSDGSLFLYGA